MGSKSDNWTPVEAAHRNPTFALRPPNTPSAAGYEPAPLRFLEGKWHVTHSTLPMWKSKRNVSITYTLLPPSSGAISADNTDRIDDLVQYQSFTSDKVSTVHGVDKAAAGDRRDAWDWRGKGLLMVASSHWQILGWGDENKDPGQSDRNAWVVTFFAKTMFTPAGVDVYSRSKMGLNPLTVQKIETALSKIDDVEVRELAKGLFSVKMDGV